MHLFQPNHALYGSHPFYIALEKDGKANGVFLHNSNIMGNHMTLTYFCKYIPLIEVLKKNEYHFIFDYFM